MDREAGRGGWLIVTIRLESGEKLPLVVDTGSPATCLDKSLEPKLGQRANTGSFLNFGVKHDTDIYVSPKIFLGKTQLEMTGPYIVAYDCKEMSADAGRPIMGILGMDVLEHYCIQMDFAAGKVRFLDGQTADKKGWGQPFPLTDVGDGCLTIRDNLTGAKGADSLIDTGCDYDGWLTPSFFQQWTNQAAQTTNGEVHAPKGVLGEEKYAQVDLDGLDAKLSLSGDTHIKYNGIGLHFLSQHLVTLDLPGKTMYLKRTSSDPLLDERKAAVVKSTGESAARYLKGLEKKGELPGWSKRDDLAPGNVHLTVNFLDHEPNSLTFDHVRKTGDSANYYFYTVIRASKDSPWKLQKAWRTDAQDHVLETYSVP